MVNKKEKKELKKQLKFKKRKKIKNNISNKTIKSEYNNFKKVVGKNVDSSYENFYLIKEIFTEVFPSKDDVGKTVFQFLREKAKNGKIKIENQQKLGLLSLGKIKYNFVLSQEPVGEEIKEFFNIPIETKYNVYKKFLNNIIKGTNILFDLKKTFFKYFLLLTGTSIIFILMFYFIGYYFETNLLPTIIGQDNNASNFLTNFYNYYYLNTIVVIFSLLSLLLLFFLTLYKEKLLLEMFKKLEAYYLNNFLFLEFYSYLKIEELTEEKMLNESGLQPFNIFWLLNSVLHNIQGKNLISENTFIKLTNLKKSMIETSGKNKKIFLEGDYDDIEKVLNLYNGQEEEGKKEGFSEKIFSNIQSEFNNYSENFLFSLESYKDFYNNIIKNSFKFFVSFWFVILIFFLVYSMNNLIGKMGI